MASEWEYRAERVDPAHPVGASADRLGRCGWLLMAVATDPPAHGGARLAYFKRRVPAQRPAREHRLRTGTPA